MILLGRLYLLVLPVFLGLGILLVLLRLIVVLARITGLVLFLDGGGGGVFWF